MMTRIIVSLFFIYKLISLKTVKDKHTESFDFLKENQQPRRKVRCKEAALRRGIEYST